jgi:hypothetical protein
MTNVVHPQLARVYQLDQQDDRHVLSLDGAPVAVLRGGGAYAVGPRWRAREAWAITHADGRPLGTLRASLPVYDAAIVTAHALEEGEA